MARATNMNIFQLSSIAGVYACLLILTSDGASAQHDTVEFKLIPKYFPEQNSAYTTLEPPELVSKPDILFPSDPNLQGRRAKVFVKLLVDAKGIVRDARVLKSTDDAFDTYAIRYAKQYKFRLSNEAAKLKKVWIAISIVFKQ